MNFLSSPSSSSHVNNINSFSNNENDSSTTTYLYSNILKDEPSTP